MGLGDGWEYLLQVTCKGYVYVGADRLPVGGHLHTLTCICVCVWVLSPQCIFTDYVY